MEHEMKVFRCRFLLTMALCFTFGLIFGLLMHLPAVSFMDENADDSPLVAIETDSRWQHEGKRLNGKPVGVRLKRSLQNSEVHITIPAKDEPAHDNAKNTDSSPKSSSNYHSLNHITDGIFWSQKLETKVPNGFSDSDLDDWRNFASLNKIVSVEEGCGRMQNRLVTFEDGTQSCARYRINTDQIQGEVYSFYLSRLLGMTNIPPLVMLTADLRLPQWKSVSSQVTEARWSDEKPLILTKFVDNLVPAYIPQSFRHDERKLIVDDSLLSKSESELVELVQWSDLIIIDYLTGNLDRIVNNMFNKQWNNEIMDGPAHNLEKTNDLLIFLDNESGLFHGYRLLDKYQTYHEQLLKSLCIFRRQTVDKLRQYHDNSHSLSDDLHRSVRTYENHHDLLPSIPEKNVKILLERIGHVLDQVSHCQSR